LQAKQLRVLEEKQVWQVGADQPVPVDVRVIAATNRNIPALTKAQRFREDYPLQVNVFMAAAVSPTGDLRRILAVRNFLEADPAFLVSLDGSPDQRPLLFVQVCIPPMRQMAGRSAQRPSRRCSMKRTSSPPSSRFPLSARHRRLIVSRPQSVNQ
jgi:hypothetical protein